MLRFAIFIIFINSFLAVHADVKCTSCKRAISGQYLLSKDKKPFCSKKCFASTLPKCSQCNHVIVGRFKTLNGKAFCSDKCFSKILPKCTLCTKPVTKAFKVDESKYCPSCIELDRCFLCTHPFHKGVVYKDGRKFCLKCKNIAVFSNKEALALYRKAAVEHKALLGVAGVKIPPLEFVSLKKIKEFNHNHDDGGMSLRGFYQEVKLQKETLDQNDKVISRSVTKTGETIYILNGLSKEDIMVTAIHELTHDWLSDYYQGIKVAPLWLEEGFCQYVSYVYCKNKKLEKLALKIKSAPDQVYGKGAKFYIEKFGEGNIKGALKWMVSQKYQIKPPIGAERKN